MIITKTPLRVSFAGGGSDLKEYYIKFGGSVLSTSINKYIYLSAIKNFNKNEILLKYSTTERIFSVNDIKHNILREVLKYYNINNLDFNSSADLPSGTGLGSSSAFTSGLILLSNAFKGIDVDKEYIASKACEIEIEHLNHPIGKQDQYASTYGGLNFISFKMDGSVEVEKINLKSDIRKQLNNRLLLFYIGTTRSANNILEEQKNNSNKIDKITSLHNIVELSELLKQDLKHNNISNFGEILNEGWEVKKSLASEISNSRIDYYYKLAIQNGAIGGKLLGAGGAGFLLFYCLEENQEKLIKALKELDLISFEMENEGSKIIYKD